MTIEIVMQMLFYDCVYAYIHIETLVATRMAISTARNEGCRGACCCFTTCFSNCSRSNGK